MISRNLSRRLERLEARLTPTNDQRVLEILVPRVGEPGEIIELGFSLFDWRDSRSR